MRALSFVVFAIVSASAYCAERTNVDAPVLWKGVEVVTNDFDSIDRIRNATPLAADSTLAPSDPKLRVACDAVRNRFPSSRIECSSVPASPTKGTPAAWFVVEVDIPEQAALRCLPGARLDPRLVALSQHWLQVMDKASAAGQSPAERVNQRNYLDFEEVELKGIAAVLYTATRDRTVEVEAGSVSCNPIERMHSLHLMNFTGDPQRFVTMAAVHVNDDHEGAANAASGFLARFAEFIEAHDVPHVAGEVCKGVSRDFGARERSIRLLTALQDTGVISFAQLSQECQQQLRNIARTSLALPAKEFVGGQGRQGPS